MYLQGVEEISGKYYMPAIQIPCVGLQKFKNLKPRHKMQTLFLGKMFLHHSSYARYYLHYFLEFRNID
jgi:hypothetical protein